MTGGQKFAFVSFSVMVIGSIIGVFWMVSAITAATDVEIGKAYPIMVSPCEKTNVGGTNPEKRYEVVFVGQTPRDMRRQSIPPEQVRLDTTLPPGHGMWIKKEKGTIQGIYYGWELLFLFNGELQKASVIHKCPGD